ncbi:unnamed protein product [Urochloa humidicola]
MPRSTPVDPSADPPPPLTSPPVAVVSFSIAFYGSIENLTHAVRVNFTPRPEVALPTSVEVAAGLSQSQGSAGERRQSEEAEPSPNSTRRIPIMSSPAAEPPPKKRKLVDAQDPSPSSASVPAAPPSPAPPHPETLAAAAPSTSSPPATETAPLPSEEEKLQKRRNREELCKVMVQYRRIRDYIGQRKDCGPTPELEQDYLNLISASRGCESIQCFLSLPIPRFASHFPTALEAATKVTINMYKCNMATVTRSKDSTESDDVKGKGLYFLNQLTCHLNSNAASDAPDDKNDGQSGTKNIVDSNPSSNDNVDLENSMVEPKECYITMAISRHPSLRRWMLSRYKKLCDSCKPAVVSEVSSCLKVLGSLSEPVEDKIDLGNESSVLEKLNKNTRENMQPDELVSSSVQGALSKTENKDNYGDNSSQNKNTDMVHTENKKYDRPADAKIDHCKGLSVVSNTAHQGTKPDLLTAKSVYDSAGGSTSLTSPGQHFRKAKHIYSEPFDIYGAYIKRDVISVSKELWVGSLGNRAAEALVRSKFEEFGPLANFLFYPSKDFSLVEYRNIVHAVHACGYMQGSSIWGGFLQIRYIDRLIGSKGFICGVAIGESRHIFVSKVKNQKDKDEVFDELKVAGLKRPCGVTDLSGENALLLEFETAVDAATAKVCIRSQAPADVFSRDKNAPGHPLFVQNVDNSVPDMELINAFSRFGEVIRCQFNRSDGNCFVVYRSQDAAACAKSHLHGARFGPKSIIVESRTSVGSVHDKTVLPFAPLLGQSFPDNSIHQEIRNPRVSGYHAGYAPPGDRPIYGPPPPPNTNRAPQGIHPCPPVSTHRGSVIPPPPIQTSFVRPLYHGPRSPWENTTPNPPPFSHVSPRMMPGSNFRVNPAPLPFLPSPVNPIAQLPGGPAQHSEKMPPPPPPPNVAPPPFAPLDMPPPPPLPISQPPSVPPPPNSPPPAQPVADSSDLQKPCSQPRWQGFLAKSSMNYCRVYASRVELDACRYENSVSEPTEWPEKLDVTKRTDFQHVKTTFSNTPPSKREVCRLLPCSDGDQKGFQDFISYLKNRECAGVIRVPAVNSMWTRLLFILPPTSEACALVALPPHPSDCMIVVICPRETTVEAS